MIDTLKPGDTYKKTQYEKLGGEEGVRQLVTYFYDEMDTDPQVKELRDTHNADLSDAREKLFLFLSGWLGGPSLYIEKYGHPRLRQRHMPFSIGVVERNQWLHCMDKALTKMNIEKAMHDELIKAFFNTADFMRNK
jgi:hemoglobin